MKRQKIEVSTEEEVDEVAVATTEEVEAASKEKAAEDAGVTDRETPSKKKMMKTITIQSRSTKNTARGTTRRKT